MFIGLDVEDGESADTMVALFKHLITTLGKTDFSNKLADDIVWVLLMEVGDIPRPALFLQLLLLLLLHYLFHLVQGASDEGFNDVLMSIKIIYVGLPLEEKIHRKDGLDFSDSVTGHKFKPSKHKAQKAK